MSRPLQVLEVRPLPYDCKQTEHVTLPAVTCPVCIGRGGWSTEIGHDQYEETTCPVCQGTGRIAAHVTIEWKPASAEGEA